MIKTEKDSENCGPCLCKALSWLISIAGHDEASRIFPKEFLSVAVLPRYGIIITALNNLFSMYLFICLKSQAIFKFFWSILPGNLCVCLCVCKAMMPKWVSYWVYISHMILWETQAHIESCRFGEWKLKHVKSNFNERSTWKEFTLQILYSLLKQ